jgi:tRNA threonylcarbamoyladenosine biosynthesis protein TsaB
VALILTIDTTTTQSGVALVEGRGAGEAPVVRAVRRAVVTTHSEALLEMIDAVLGEAGVRPPELAVIACAAGPGSFTGLRIGLATAKGLCLGLAKPLLLVPSLAALAIRVRPAEGTLHRRSPASVGPDAGKARGEGRPEGLSGSLRGSGVLVVACIDAFKGEVYVGRYRGADDQGPALTGEEETIAPARLAEELRARVAEGPVVLVGDGMARWPELRVAGLTAIDEGPPDPVDVGRLAARRWARGEHDDLAGATPRYVRPSEAELMERQRAASQQT